MRRLGALPFTVLLWLPLTTPAQAAPSAADQTMVKANGSPTSRSLATRFADFLNPLDYGATCEDGDAARALAATQAAAGAAKGIVVTCALHLSSAAGNISAPLRFEGGGALTVLPGGSVTLSGPLSAALAPIFKIKGGTLKFKAKVKDVLPQWWGAVADGATDDTTALQSALDAAFEAGGGVAHLPRGTYLQTRPVTIRPNVTLRGDGPSSSLVCNSDIEQLVTERTAGVANTGIMVQDIALDDARRLDSAGRTKRTRFQVRFTNCIRCLLRNVQTRTNPADMSAPNTANLGGIHMEKLGTNSYVNEITDSWIRNGSLLIESSDTQVSGGWYWGSANPYAIRVAAANVRILGADIIPSPVNGGVYASPTAYFTTISGCFFDGSDVPGVVTGDQIYGEFQDLKATGNTFWYSFRSAIHLTAAENVIISGNTFSDCNRSKGGFADVLIKPARGKTAKGVLVTGNTFSNRMATSGPGYCIEENDSLSPGGTRLNVFRDNYRSTLGGSRYAGSIATAGRLAERSYERSTIGPNVNMGTFNSGTATIPDRAEEIVVTHGLGRVPFPHEVSVTAVDEHVRGHTFWVPADQLTSTTFKIRVSPEASGSTSFAWSVRLTR